LPLDLFACLLTTANRFSAFPSTADWISAWRPVTETVLLQTTAAEDGDNLSHSMSNSLSLCALSVCPFCPRCGKPLHHRRWSLRAYIADPSYCSRRAPGVSGQQQRRMFRAAPLVLSNSFISDYAICSWYLQTNAICFDRRRSELRGRIPWYIRVRGQREACRGSIAWTSNACL
jgi:hypothetical protein